MKTQWQMGLGQEFVTGTFTEEEESESQMGLAAQDINARNQISIRGFS